MVDVVYVMCIMIHTHISDGLAHYPLRLPSYMDCTHFELDVNIRYTCEIVTQNILQTFLLRTIEYQIRFSYFTTCHASFMFDNRQQL